MFPISLEHPQPETRKKDIELNNNSIYEECIAQTRPCITLNVGHEEAKTHEHHDIDILVHGIVSLGVAIDIDSINPDEEAVEDDDDGFNHTYGYSKLFEVRWLVKFLIFHQLQ